MRIELQNGHQNETRVDFALHVFLASIFFSLINEFRLGFQRNALTHAHAQDISSFVANWIWIHMFHMFQVLFLAIILGLLVP